VARVALTFDTEHPSRPHAPGGLDAILAALAERDVRATFFLQGRWARSDPARARAIAGAGHVVGSHAHHHAPLTALRDEWLSQEIDLAQEAIAGAAGVDPRPWFRCPFGAGGDDPRVLAALGAAGYRHVGWDVDPEDWAPGRTADELVARVLDGVRARAPDDSVVLMHSWPTATGEGIATLLDALAATGAQLVAIDEMGSG